MQQQFGAKATGIDRISLTGPDFEYHKLDLNKEKANFADKFDVISMQGALHHVVEQKSVLKFVSENLSKDGVFILDEVFQ